MDILVTSSTIEEEINRIWHYIRKYQSVSKLTSDIVFPNDYNPYVHKTYSDISQLVTTEYSSMFYEPGIKHVSSGIPIILDAIKSLEKYETPWGFKLEPKYTVRLTRYGTGGSYDVTTHHIVMRTNEYGTFVRKNPAATPIHEIVHLCTESLVMNNHLSFNGKEKLIGGICVVLFPEIFDTNHKFKDSERIDMLNKLTNLQEFIKENINQLDK